jgi:hypothetical protein
MKSKPLILTAVLLLIPILVLAVPVNLAVKMGAGCPFKPGPKIDRCKPSAIHSNENFIDLIGLTMPAARLCSSLPSFLSGQFHHTVIAFALDSRTLFPLRC